MSFKINSVSYVLDPNNQKRFKFPANTLLDQISTDLWAIIFKYYYCHQPFAIGNFDTNYLGYRIITQKECKTRDFKDLFEEYYRNTHMFRSLDNIKLYHPGRLFNTTEIIKVFSTMGIFQKGVIEILVGIITLTKMNTK